MKASRATLLLLVIAIVWGSGFAISQVGYNEGITPIQLIAGRFVVASLFMDIIFFKTLKSLNRRLIHAGCVIGVFLVLAFIFQNYGLMYSTPSVCAFVTSVYVVMVPFLGWIIYKKRPNTMTLIASVTAVAGVSVFSVTENLTLSVGAVLTFIASGFYAFQVMGIEHYTKEHDPIALTIVTINFTAIISFVIAAFGVISGSAPLVLTRLGVGTLVYLGMLCTALCFLGQNIGQKYTSASRASIVMSTESVFGSLFSILIFGEILTVKILIGAFIIFVSVIMSESVSLKH